MTKRCKLEKLKLKNIEKKEVKISFLHRFTLKEHYCQDVT